MTIPELINKSQEELALTQQIIENLVHDLHDYPKGHYNTSKLTRLEHAHQTLQTLNNLLSEPVY